MHCDISYYTRRNRIPLIINDLGDARSNGFAHGPDADRIILQRSNNQRAFRLPVAVTDRNIEMMLERVDDFQVERFTGGHGAAQLGQVIP
ncbi:hypothetical protein D3C80_1333800 [compost metagenome]